MGVPHLGGLAWAGVLQKRVSPVARVATADLMQAGWKLGLDHPAWTGPHAQLLTREGVLGIDPTPLSTVRDVERVPERSLAGDATGHRWGCAEPVAKVWQLSGQGLEWAGQVAQVG